MMPPPCASTRFPSVSLKLIPGGFGGAIGVAVTGSVRVPITEPAATVQLPPPVPVVPPVPVAPPVALPPAPPVPVAPPVPLAPAAPPVPVTPPVVVAPPLPLPPPPVAPAWPEPAAPPRPPAALLPPVPTLPPVSPPPPVPVPLSPDPPLQASSVEQANDRINLATSFRWFMGAPLQADVAVRRQCVRRLHEFCHQAPGV